MKYRVHWAVAVAVAVAVGLGPWGCRRRSEPANPVIPPGQEALVSRMLSAPGLPTQCALDEASIDHDHIAARYRCGADTAHVTLVHPTKAPSTAVRTAQFALTTTDAPAPLLTALVAGIRTQEAEFHWLMPAARPDPPRRR